MDRKSRLHAFGRYRCRPHVSRGDRLGATPSSSIWALLDVTGADGEGRRWLDEKGKQLHEEIHASTFDAAAFECALDLVGAGWFALYIDVDRDAGGFTFTQWPLSSCFCSTTKAGGLVDTVFREYTLTAEQAGKEFGVEKVSADTAKKAEVDPDAPVTICHAIYPRSTYAVGARLAKNLPIASCHFEVDSKQLLRERLPRDTCDRAALGRDSRQRVRDRPHVRRVARRPRAQRVPAHGPHERRAGHRGMWIAEDDGVLNPRTVKVGPRRLSSPTRSTP